MPFLDDTRKYGDMLIKTLWTHSEGVKINEGALPKDLTAVYFQSSLTNAVTQQRSSMAFFFLFLFLPVIIQTKTKKIYAIPINRIHTNASASPILSLGLMSATSREGLISPVVNIYNMTVSCFSDLHLSPVSQNSLKKSALQLQCSHVSVLSPSSRAAPRLPLTNVCLSGQQVILLSLNTQHPHPPTPLTPTPGLQNVS